MLLKLPLDEQKRILWTIEDKNKVKKALQKIKGEFIDLEITEAKESVTAEQRGYLFMIVFPIIMEHTGYSKDQLLTLFYKMFNTYYILIGDEEIETHRTISEFKTKKEMSEFMSKIIDYSITEWNLDFPEPKKVNKKYKTYDN